MLPANTTFNVRPPSAISVVHVVQPFVWPGVSTAFSVMPPSVHGVAVLQNAVDFHRGKLLRIAEQVVALPAGLDQRRVALHDHHFAAAGLLQRRQAPHMIEVRLRGEEHLDVLDLEAELANGALDERGRLWQSAVNQDMPGRRRDQERGQLAGADVVDRAGDREGRKRQIPARRIELPR